MADIESNLAERASALAPTAGQREGAARSHNSLREELTTGHIGQRILGSYLTGSYARHTAIRPLDDVDVVFEIDASRWSLDWWNGRPAPEAVLETFARATRLRYPNTRVQTQRRSIGLQMNHLQIDLVPAIRGEREGWLLIPDTQTRSWISTAPKVHEAIGTAVNSACDQKLKPLVRLLKGWNHSLPERAALKSFAVETLATTVMGARPHVTLTDGFLTVLDFIAWRGGLQATFKWGDPLGVSLSSWSRTLPDLARTGSNVIACVDSRTAGEFCARAFQMRNAVLAATGSKSTSDEAWRTLSPLIMGGLARL